MPKASLTLSNGTVVNIDGTVEEIQVLLNFYGGAKHSGGMSKTHQLPPPPKQHAAQQEQALNLTEIVSLVKSCPLAEKIEKQILDRTSAVNRVLLTLFIVQEHMQNVAGLTSGEIAKVTLDLGIPIAGPNVSNTLSGTASKYVIGDKVRKRGQLVRYKINRRGTQYLKAVIENTNG